MFQQLPNGTKEYWRCSDDFWMLPKTSHFLSTSWCLVSLPQWRMHQRLKHDWWQSFTGPISLTELKFYMLMEEWNRLQSSLLFSTSHPPTLLTTGPPCLQSHLISAYNILQLEEVFSFLWCKNNFKSNSFLIFSFQVPCWDFPCSGKKYNSQ